MSVEVKSNSEENDQCEDDHPMTREVFIQNMIEALASAQISSPSSFTSSVPIVAKTSSQVFQSLCYDFPVYISTDLMTFRLALTSWVGESSLSNFPVTTQTFITRKSSKQSFLSSDQTMVAFYYHEVFITNIYSIAANVTKDDFKLTSKTSSSSSSTSTTTITNGDINTNPFHFPDEFKSIEEDQTVSNEEIVQIYVILFIFIPYKLLSSELLIWSHFFPKDNISWLEYLISYRRLLQGVSGSILTKLGQQILSQQVLPNISKMIQYFSSFLSLSSSSSSLPIHGNLKNIQTLREYISVKQHQLSSVSTKNEELSEECQDVVDCVKDILTTLVFLARDIFIESPELVTNTNIRDILQSIDTNSSVTDESSLSSSLRPQQYLILSFLYGLSQVLVTQSLFDDNTTHHAILAGKKSILSKAIIGLQTVILPNLSLIVTMSDILLRGSNNSNRNTISSSSTGDDGIAIETETETETIAVTDDWNMIVIITQVLLLTDHHRTTASTISSIHEKIISSRLFINLTDIWVHLNSSLINHSIDDKTSGMNSRSKNQLLEKLTKLLSTMIRQNTSTAQYFYRLSDIPSSMTLIYSYYTTQYSILSEKTYQERINLIYSTMNEFISSHVTSMICFWLLMSLPVDILSVSSTTSTTNIDNSLMSMLSTYLNLSSLISKTIYQIEESSQSISYDNIDEMELEQHDQLQDKQQDEQQFKEEDERILSTVLEEVKRRRQVKHKAEDIRRLVGTSIVTTLRLLDCDTFRNIIFRGGFDAIKSATIALVKKWSDETMIALNGIGGNVLVDDIRRRLKSLKASIDGQTTNKVD